MEPSIDFLEEFGLSAEREFDITEMLHIENDIVPISRSSESRETAAGRWRHRLRCRPMP